MSSPSRYPCWTAVLLLFLHYIPLLTAAPVEVSKRAISADVYDKLQLFSQYSAAAYCEGNNNSTGTKITCPQGNCARVEAANATSLTEFENSLVSDVTGFVATDTTNSLIVVSFRGSRSIRNWITNLEFGTVSTTICSDCEASDGFWNSWNEAQAGVLKAVAQGRAAYPNFKVVATGHSLGGALASLGAGVLRSQGVSVDLYTYGSPKVGLAGLANYLTATTQGSSFRVTHLNDPVPRLPPAAVGFRHVSPEYYITTNDTVLPTTSDIDVFTGIDNQNGNEKDTGFDIDAHKFYFGHISACDGQEGIEF